MNRNVIAVLIALMAGLQAWDSGVLGAGALVIALVFAGIVLLAAAVALGRSRDYAVWLLLGGGALIVTARVVSPIGLNELFIVFPIAVMPFLMLRLLDRRAHAGV